MWTTWFWVVMNKGLLIAFFGLGAMRGQRKAGSVYARFGLIPLTSVINFITQILVLYAYYAYYYDYKCTTTCYKIRKASFGLAIISLILSVVVIIDLIVASCKKPKPIPRRRNALFSKT
jgi:fumarate reductase subunit C